MKTKNIFKALAFAMLMPAVLLTTSCSKGDDLVNNTAENTETVANKGYALPVTVNVTRQGDGTRATYNESTRKLEFSTGDKLFVNGKNDNGPGQFAGTLDYVPATGKFSGTIYTRNSYSGTADALFLDANPIYATLLPNGYESTGFLEVIDNNTPEIYDDGVIVHETKAFVASETAKSTGVEQLSLEQARSYSDGFALSPGNAILNFTISVLEAGAKEVSLKIHHGFDYDVTGSVTPNALGVATFAIGVPVGSNIKEMSNNLTVGTHNFTLPSSTTFAVGKIYNITRVAIPGALIGQFSVSNTKKVYFSKGNLRYVSGTWSFFDHQYDCYNTYSADAWDKFGWVGQAASLKDSEPGKWGVSISKEPAVYGTNPSEKMASDWGNVPGIGTGWRTLSYDEWNYLFNERPSAAAKYGYATVNSVHGIIILPDVFTDPNKNNGSNAFVGSTTTGWDANVYTSENWAFMEAAGAVFLPVAGFREGDWVTLFGDDGHYWSSTVYSDSHARNVTFGSNTLAVTGCTPRYYGLSVRLVRQVK